MRRLLALIPLSLLAFGIPASVGATTKTVRLQDTSVHPVKVSIQHGDSVTWRFLDGDKDEAHNVTSYGKKRFRSSTDQKTGTYTVRFLRVGTYRFHCTIHPNMQGRVVVR